MTFAFLALSIFVLIYLWIKKRYNTWNARGFIGPPGHFPFGSSKGFGQTKTPCLIYDDAYKSYKGKAPAIGIYLFLEPEVLIIDPELVKNVIVRDFKSFNDRGFYYNKKDDPLSVNLLSLEGNEWRERRTKLTPVFTASKMKGMFDIIDSIGNNLIETVDKNLKENDSLNMRDFAGRFTADVIGNVSFGFDCKCLENPNSEFIKHGRRLFDLTSFEIIKFFVCTGFPNFARKLGLRQSPKEPTDFFHNTYLQTFEYRQKNNIQRNDFVSMLLGLKDSFTPDELAAEAFLVFNGGFESSSTLITFALYELALNPEIQQRLRDEIRMEIEDTDGKMTYDFIHGLKYLDQVVNETLRHYPSIPFSTRKCTIDYEIPETSLVIPKGTLIHIPTYSLQHDPEYYEDPFKFDPERFTPENVKARNPFTLLPFGEGPRNCIGMRFGLMQSKIAIVKLIKNFEFEPTERTPIPMKFVPSSPFLTPVGGMWLKIKKIE